MWQCELVGISRPSFYYDQKGESELNLMFMKLIDAQFLETPWYASRQMARWLRRRGHGVRRPRTQRLIRHRRRLPQPTAEPSGAIEQVVA